MTSTFFPEIPNAGTESLNHENWASVPAEVNMAAEVLKPREWDDLFDCTDLAEHRELKQAKVEKNSYI